MGIFHGVRPRHREKYRPARPHIATLHGCKRAHCNVGAVWGASCRTYNSYDTILTDSFRSTGVCDEGESFSGQSTRAGVHDKRASLVFAGNERCEYIQGEIHAARILSRVSGNCQPSQACCCRCTPVIHFSVVVCGYEFSTRHNPRQPSPRADCHRAGMKYQRSPGRNWLLGHDRIAAPAIRDGKWQGLAVNRMTVSPDRALPTRLHRAIVAT